MSNKLIEFSVTNNKDYLKPYEYKYTLMEIFKRFIIIPKEMIDNYLPGIITNTPYMHATFSWGWHNGLNCAISYEYSHTPISFPYPSMLMKNFARRLTSGFEQAAIIDGRVQNAKNVATANLTF